MIYRKRRASYAFPTLAAYLAATPVTQVQLAVLTGTTQAHISRIASGDVIPRSRLAARLAQTCRIPLDSFTRVYLLKHAGRVA